MTTLVVNIAVEGATDLAVAHRLLEECGLTRGEAYGQRGKQHLDRSINGFNAAARRSAWLVLRDLDHDAECAPKLVSYLLPRPAQHMVLRVPVRSIETWLLADGEAIAEWLGIPTGVVPTSPEREEEPKDALLALARRSRSRRLKEALLPVPASGAKVGPLYLSEIEAFVRTKWNPGRGAARSPSLARAIRALDSLR